MVAEKKTKREEVSGKLRIGDMWNAITIIAMSQTNPLKAIAEFVENSIDAKSRNITIVRGKKRGRAYLRVTDDGEGIPCDEQGIPDFKYVATHICDSIKRQMREKGVTGIQGEFGIGLLSFWTVGQELTLTCSGNNGHTYQMRMIKGNPGYTVRKSRMLFPADGTELIVTPILPGIRRFSGEKIQWYLASELRDRIRTSGVNIKVIDRQARREFDVQPRHFEGQLLHQLPVAATSFGDIYLELYMTQPGHENNVGLYRSGTRVIENMSGLDRFSRDPWTSGYLEGIIDAPFLKLTPGTRGGVIHDETYMAFCSALEPVEKELVKFIQEQREAEDQRASRQILKSVQKALREALLALPAEEYDWFNIRTAGHGQASSQVSLAGEKIQGTEQDNESSPAVVPVQKQFFEYEGSLFSVCVVPASCVVPVNSEKHFRVLPRDKSGRPVEKALQFCWHIVDGDGQITNSHGECATFIAGAEPGLTRIEVTVTQAKIECHGEALITVTDSLIPEAKNGSKTRKGLPGYTFHKAPGQLWRSKYDEEKNLVIINSGHRDFVYASRNNARKLRYICRLFSKELVFKNFPGIPSDQLLERMIELSLYNGLLPAGVEHEQVAKHRTSNIQHQTLNCSDFGVGRSMFGVGCSATERERGYP